MKTSSLKYLVSSRKPGRKRFKFVSECLNQKHNIIKPATNPNLSSTKKSGALLTDLPTELLIEIFSNLKFASQVSLGLTCKSLGSVLEMVDINWDRYGGDLAELLMENLKDWMPTTHKFCVYCTKYIPMDKGCWKSDYDCMIKGEALGAVVCWMDPSEDNSQVICTRCFQDAVKCYKIMRGKLRTK